MTLPAKRSDGVFGVVGRWFKDLDRILRGEATSLPALRQGLIHVPAWGLSQILVLLGALYGLCMGAFALFNRGWGATAAQQILASMIKVPLLFFLTLLVTFPSLYIFNALVGSRLGVVSLMRLLVASMGVTLAVLASFGTIVAFFAVTTTSYPFMLLLNVAAFTLAGVLGLRFLLQTLQRLTVALDAPPPERPRVFEATLADAPGSEGAAESPGAPESPEAPLLPPTQPAPLEAAAPEPMQDEVVTAGAALERVRSRPHGALEPIRGHVLSRHVSVVFRCWVVVFALVGAQMSWVLRPFVGDPSLPFTWFRPRESNFFEAVWRTLQRLLE